MAKDNGQEPQVTSGVEWRKPREEGLVILLPSGNIARLRPVAIDVMIATGKIPDMLTPLAAKTLWTSLDPDKIAEVAEMATGFADLFNVVCRASFIEPKIVDEGEEPEADNEISIEDISFTDKGYVFQLAIQPTEVLQKFRDEQNERLAAIPAGESDKQKAK